MKRAKELSIKNQKQHITTIIVLFLVFVAIIVLILRLKGSTTTTNQEIDDDKTASLVCMSTTAKHPKLTRLSNSVGKELKTTLVFRAEQLSTAGLIYTIYYKDARAVRGGESALHAELNINLAESGISGAFNVKYNQYDDRLVVNLNAEGGKVDEQTAPYFLINTNDGGQLIDWTIEDYANNYQKQGFSCEQKS